MNITIHRGVNQIGGCITEISTEDCKVLIDLGSNLPGTGKVELTAEQVSEITEGADAVFYTHYHGDHIGLHHLVPAHVPQCLGPGAKEVLLGKYEALMAHGDYTKLVEAVKRMHTYHTARRMDVSGKGKIFVTPYFVSHSAFDAYMLLIECEGKRILHTGDFRGHGFLGKGLFPTLETWIGNVDVLITEGTMLGRKQEHVLTEGEITRHVIQALRMHKYVFALCSSTDLERLAAFHQACKETKRIFIVDKYQKSVLDIFMRYAGKKSDCFRFDAFELINYRTKKVKNRLQSMGFLIPVRASSFRLIKGMLDVYNDEQPWLIYSMWSGYAEPDSESANEEVIRIRSLFPGRIYDGVKDGFHTSGHADVQTLREVCQTVKPRIGVIPIHKEAGHRYEELGLSDYKVFGEGETETNNIHISIQ